MKEIKFRAFDKEKAVMFPVRELRMLPEKPMVWSTSSDVGIPLRYVELMQFTGLKDKNGKEIFEGDIVKIAGMIHEVKYEGACFQIPAVPEHLLIVGNIWEHPDLLK